MAITLIKRDWSTELSSPMDVFVMDSAADAANLPESPTGSLAIVADKGGPIWMVNASGEWKEQ